MRTGYSGTVVLACAVLCSSCAPRRAEVALSTATVSAPMLVDLVEARSDRLRSLVGKGSVTFETPEVGGSAFFELALKKPDSLLIRFEGPFGMTVGTLFLCPQKFVMYNSMENSVTSGTPSSRSIRSVIPFDLTYDQILDAFAGSFPIPRRTDDLVLYTIDDEKFLLSFRSAGRTSRYWVDPAWLLVTKYQVVDSLGAVVLNAEASGMNEQDDLYAPSRISVEFPGEQRRIWIYYSSQTLNAENPSFAYSIPPNARTTLR